MQAFHYLLCFPRMFPSDGLFRPKSRLGNHVLRRMAGNTRKPEFLQRHAIRRAEKRAHVIEAANILEKHADGKRPDVIVGLSGEGGAVRRAVARYNGA